MNTLCTTTPGLPSHAWGRAFATFKGVQYLSLTRPPVSSTSGEAACSATDSGAQPYFCTLCGEQISCHIIDRGIEGSCHTCGAAALRSAVLACSSWEFWLCGACQERLRAILCRSSSSTTSFSASLAILEPSSRADPPDLSNLCHPPTPKR